VCPVCGGEDPGGETRRHLWICTACGRQTPVTAGTVMHGTRLPLRTCFWAAYLVSTFHPGISAKQLQRQLGIGCHETAWAVLHKLRGAMVAPERELLKGEVEIDEFYLGGYEEGLKGSRQRGKNALCGIAIEVCGQGSGRLRLQVLPDASSASLLALTKATTTRGAIVHTDGYQAYNVLTKNGYYHRRRPKQSVAPGDELLPRAHRAISNLKAWMHGTPRSLARAPARLPRRVRLPPQPTRHTDGRLPDATRTRAHTRADHLPPDHRPSRLTTSWSEPGTH
jgi:hypothetical protein